MRHYAVIDVETTGSLPEPSGERITEIAIFRHDGEKIVDQFVSLINPEVPIPAFIQRLTGIDDEMVEDAPLFEDVADEIDRITKDAIFVAHNVGFDFRMVRGEFERIGRDFSRSRMCTVRLSRVILPGFPSYSLGKLSKSLGIQIKNRHRASGDAEATVSLLEMMIEKDVNAIHQHLRGEIGVSGMHPDFDLNVLQEIPEKAGLYYLYDAEGTLLYLGHGANIHRQVFSLLRGVQSERMKSMKMMVRDISYVLTGSTLMAKLNAANELAADKPAYNKGLQHPNLKYSINTHFDAEGYLQLSYGKITENDQVQTKYVSELSASRALRKAVKTFELCPHFSGEVAYNTKICIYEVSDQCLGACQHKMPADEYNSVVSEALQALKQWNQHFLIVDKGRHEGERSLFLVDHGSCKYGYADHEHLATVADMLHHITQVSAVETSVGHIHKYLENFPVERVVFDLDQ